MLKFGNIRRQVTWLGSVAAMAGGLQIFSQLPGEFNNFVSDTFIRIVLNFKIVTNSIWEFLGNYIGVEIDGFEGALTFSCLVVAPYIFRYRDIRMGNLFDEENRLLTSLNFLSFVFVSNVFSSEYNEFNDWYIALSAVPLLFFMVGIIINGYIKEYYYFNVIRILVSISIVSSLIFCIIILIFNMDEITLTDNYIVLLIVTLLSNSAYSFGLFFKIEGYYPLLFACVFFAMYYLMDLVLRASPSIDSYLTSIGA